MSERGSDCGYGNGLHTLVLRAKRRNHFEFCRQFPWWPHKFQPRWVHYDAAHVGNPALGICLDGLMMEPS